MPCLIWLVPQTWLTNHPSSHLGINKTSQEAGFPQMPLLQACLSLLQGVLYPPIHASKVAPNKYILTNLQTCVVRRCPFEKRFL